MLFTDPGEKQHWPIVAACWSPTTPLIGIGVPVIDLLVTPKLSAEFFTSGKIFFGTLNKFKISLSHLLELILNNKVLDAIEWSIAALFAALFAFL